jgi:hypothetical protein
MTEYRIRCVATCPAPDHHHLVYFLDFQDRIFSGNMKSGRTELITNIQQTRGFLDSSEQLTTMSISQDDNARIIKVFWRKGEGLWYCKVWVATRRVSPAENIRGQWDEVFANEE